MSKVYFGFDVSHHQNPKLFTFNQVPAYANPGGGAGVDFMIARASYGKLTADRHFVEWAEKIRAAKITFGVYLFYRQIHTVEDQLALFDRQLDLIGGLKPGDMYPVLDMEENHLNGDGLPKAKHFSDSCRRIAEIWKDQFGGCVLYYSSFFPEYLKEHKGWIKDWDLHWLADYSVADGKPRTPYSPKDTWNLHQPRNRVSSLYPVFDRDGKQVVIDHNFSNPSVDFSKLLIKAEDLDDGVSDDARDCEDGTTDRPGGALPEDELAERLAREAGFKKLAEGLIDLQDGVEALRRTR